MVEKKTIFELEVKCPYCKKLIDIKKVRKIIEEPVKGEYKDTLLITKSEQETLTQK